MKKNLCVILLCIIILITVSCEAKSTAKEALPSPEAVSEEIMPSIPLTERRFIYNNGIKVEYKENVEIGKDKVKVSYNYPIISGLKDKVVQNQINEEIKSVGAELLSQLEASLPPPKTNVSSGIELKQSNAHITYSYNNVIFIEYSAFIHITFKPTEFFPTYKSTVYGYNLNTGKRIKLSELFHKGSDFETIINNFICQHLIENNYDDYESNRMCKPFQGIREEQSYSFGLEGLRILLDEKNDEFILDGYSEPILMPLKFFDDDLVIFDKYFQEDKNIYDEEKLTKKLFPNQLEFKYEGVVEEGNERYFISIAKGKFINVPDKDIEEKLNEMVKFKSDVEGFKKRAKELKDINQNAHFATYISIFTNAGGYLSMAVSEEIFFINEYQLKRIPFNYDFNLNREMRIRDIFKEDVDINSKFKARIKNMSFNIPEEILDSAIEEALKESIFFFDESGLAFYFSPKSVKLNENDKWIWISFEEIGLEKVRFLN